MCLLVGVTLLSVDSNMLMCTLEDTHIINFIVKAPKHLNWKVGTSIIQLIDPCAISKF